MKTRFVFCIFFITLLSQSAFTQSNIEVITGHRESGLFAQFVPNSNLLVTASADRIIVWDMATSAPLKEFSQAYSYTPGRTAISTNGQLLAFITHQQTIEVWQLRDFTLLKNFPAPSTSKLVFSNDAQQLYAIACSPDLEQCHDIQGFNVFSGAKVFANNFKTEVSDMLPTDNGLFIGSKDHIVNLNPDGKIIQDFKIAGLNAIRLIRLKEKDKMAVYSDPVAHPSIKNKGTIITVNLTTGKAEDKIAIRYLDYYQDAFLIDNSIEATKKFIEAKSKIDDMENWYKTNPRGGVTDVSPIRSTLAVSTDKNILVEFEFFQNKLNVFSLEDNRYLWKLGTNVAGETLKTYGKFLVLIDETDSYGSEKRVIVWDLMKLAPLWESHSPECDIDTTDQFLYFKYRSKENVEKLFSTPIEEWQPAAVADNSYDFFKFTCGPQNLVAGNGVIFNSRTRKSDRFTNSEGGNWFTHAWCSPSRLVMAEHLIKGFTITVNDIQPNSPKSKKLWQSQEGYVSNLTTSPDGQTTAWRENGKLVKIYDIESGQKINQFEEAKVDDLPVFTFINSREIALVSNSRLSVIDFRTSKTIREIQLSESVNHMVYNRQLKKIFVLTTTGKIMMLDERDLSHSITLMASTVKDYWVYTPDGYYKGSRNCSQAVVIREGDEMLNGSETKEKYYRPDIVVERANLATPYYRRIFNRVYGAVKPAAAQKLSLKTNIQSLP